MNQNRARKGIPSESERGENALIGIALGLIIGIGGALGTVWGGRLADRLGQRDKRAYVDVPAIAVFAGAPVAAIAFMVGDAILAVALLFIPILLKSFWYGPIFALTQSLVVPASRATAAAILLFIFNLVGLGLGPLSIGVLSDLLSRELGDAEGLRWALASSCVLGPIATACFFMARRTLRDDLEG